MCHYFFHVLHLYCKSILLELLNTDSEAVYLSEGEKKLIELYRSLPKNKADILIEFYEKMKD